MDIRVSVIVIIALSLCTSCQGGCDDDWVGNDVFCYYVSKSAETWNNAKTQCEQKGANLTSIENAEERDFLTTITDTNTTDYWIGLFLMNETGEAEWTWIDGKPLSYKNWLDVEPNGSGECGRIAVNDTWRDTECSSTISHFKHDIYFLCKKENDDASGAASYVNMHATIIVLLLSLSLV